MQDYFETIYRWFTYAMVLAPISVVLWAIGAQFDLMIVKQTALVFVKLATMAFVVSLLGQATGI